MTTSDLPRSQKKIDGGRIPGPARVPGVVEVIMGFSLPNGNTGTVTLHGRNSGSFVPSVATANSLQVALAGSMNTRMTTLVYSSSKMLWVRVRDMTDPTLPQYQSTVAAANIGTGTTAMPSDVAAVLTEKLAARGRGQQGRLYIPCLSQAADATNGLITSTTQTALNQLGTDWIANMLAASLVVCVAKPARQEYIGTTGAIHPARGSSSVDVTALVCQNLEWDTQRRRGM